MIAGKLAERAEQLLADRAPFVVATVVRARRPTSVRAGDAALVLSDGSIEGFVGGACAAASVRLHGLRAMETGEPLSLRIVPEGAESTEPVEGAVVERNPCLSGGALEIFLEPQLPAPLLAVFGSSPIASALANVASAAGFQVVSDEFPDDLAAVVVASHGEDEERVLADALSTGVPYVALVASSKRGTAVREALAVPDELRMRLHTPAGLDIGARTPAQIAVAIVAEMIAEQHARPSRASSTEAIDPICGMSVAITSSTPHLDTAEGRVFFCSDGCRRSYAEQHAVAR